MVASESEDIAGFVGDSVSVPLVQGGTILFTFGYLAWVDWRIASLAALLYTPHYFIVRWVQQLINRLARSQAKVVRRSIHLTPFGTNFCRTCLVDAAEVTDLPEHGAPED